MDPIRYQVTKPGSGHQEYTQGNIEDHVHALLTELRDHTADTLLPVPKAIPEIENDADRVDEEEAVDTEKRSRQPPVMVIDGNGEEGGHVHPDEGKEDGFSDRNFLQVIEWEEMQLGGRIQEGEHHGAHQPEPVLDKMNEVPARSDKANYEEGHMQWLMPDGPADADGFRWHIGCQVPVEIITAERCEEYEEEIIRDIVL